MKILKVKDWISHKNGLAFQKMNQETHKDIFVHESIVYLHENLSKALGLRDTGEIKFESQINFKTVLQ